MYKQIAVACFLAQVAFIAAFSEYDCSIDVQGWPSCKGDVKVYTWDSGERDCVEVSYGGCNPTANNFKTREECLDIAKPVCSFGRPFTKDDCAEDVEDYPSCHGSFIVYAWDNSRQDCVQARYGGCNPTQNNFNNYFDCKRVAGKICPSDDFFTVADCSRDVELPFGCRGKFDVYKWDNAQQQCVEAEYGGCRPTKNNFGTQEECEEIATPVCKRDQFFTKADCTKEVENEPACRMMDEAYKWDDAQKACRLVSYGGCNPTPNNFVYKEDCETIAGVVCRD